MRRDFVDAVARALFAAGLTAPRRRARERLSIVTFHRVLPEPERAAYPYPALVVTPAELDALLEYFTVHFDCGALGAQHERLLRGEENGRPLLALTFDDAQHDNLRHARPLLDRYGLTATFFAPVAAVEREALLWHDRLGFAVDRARAQRLVQQAKRLPLSERLRLVEELDRGREPPGFARVMSFAELGRLAADGHEIGSHSMTHCLMPECDDAQLAYEVAESRRVLEARLYCRVESFCYPNGDNDRRVAQAVARAGYRRAVSTAWGSNGRDADRFALRRFDMGSLGGVSPARVALKMSGLAR